MKRLKSWIRYLAYICGILGAILMLVGKGMASESGDSVRVAAMMLLAAMFFLFIITYIWTALEIMIKSGRSRS